jgi:hypothetical protein
VSFGALTPLHRCRTGWPSSGGPEDGPEQNDSALDYGRWSAGTRDSAFRAWRAGIEQYGVVVQTQRAISSVEPLPPRLGASARWVSRALVLAWLLVVGWIGYEVILTRLSRSDDSWVMWDMAVLVALLLLTVGMAAGSGDRSVVRRHVAASLAAALTVLASVIWVVVAPLPQLRSVPLPPLNASPEQVVRTFVTALDEHDHATAEALCARWACAFDDYVWIRIAHIGPVDIGKDFCIPVSSDGSCAMRSGGGASVSVELTGRTRSGELPGEGGVWGYQLAAIGPQGAWRIVGQGAG